MGETLEFTDLLYYRCICNQVLHSLLLLLPRRLPGETNRDLVDARKCGGNYALRVAPRLKNKRRKISGMTFR